MAVIGFDDRAVFRLTDNETNQVIQVVKKNGDVYDSVSHFFRVATVKLLREYDKNGVKKK